LNKILVPSMTYSKVISKGMRLNSFGFVYYVYGQR